MRVGAGRLAGLSGGSGGGELVRGRGIARRRAWRGAYEDMGIKLYLSEIGKVKMPAVLTLVILLPK